MWPAGHICTFLYDPIHWLWKPLFPTERKFINVISSVICCSEEPTGNSPLKWIFVDIDELSFLGLDHMANLELNTSGQCTTLSCNYCGLTFSGLSENNGFGWATVCLTNQTERMGNVRLMGQTLRRILQWVSVDQSAAVIKFHLSLFSPLLHFKSKRACKIGPNLIRLLAAPKNCMNCKKFHWPKCWSKQWFHCNHACRQHNFYQAMFCHCLAELECWADVHAHLQSALQTIAVPPPFPAWYTGLGFNHYSLRVL